MKKLNNNTYASGARGKREFNRLHARFTYAISYLDQN